jgi:hypothetical protein
VRIFESEKVLVGFHIFQSVPGWKGSGWSPPFEGDSPRNRPAGPRGPPPPNYRSQPGLKACPDTGKSDSQISEP